MSTRIMAACWHIKTSPTAKAVLISLADNANDAGHCWPSISKIAERTCLEKTTVIRAIRRLEEEGHIIADRSNGRHTTYMIRPATLPEPVAENNRLQSATGCTAPPNRLHSATQPVAQRNTNRQEPSVTKRGSRFALDSLPAEWAAYCNERRPDLDPAVVFEDFSEYWKSMSGSSAVKTDWRMTWQRWVRKEKAQPAPRAASEASDIFDGAR